MENLRSRNLEIFYLKEPIKHVLFKFYNHDIEDKQILNFNLNKLKIESIFTLINFLIDKNSY